MKHLKIIGKLDDLVLCELLLVVFGYIRDDEEWNNRQVGEYRFATHIESVDDGVEYHNHSIIDNAIQATDFIDNPVKYL